jgi:hypothetical protein
VEVEPMPEAGRQNPAPRQLNDRDTGFEDPW